MAVAMEKYFVIGPSTQIAGGIVGEAEVARWKAYLQREGQPPLKVTAEARATLRAERVLPPQDPEADIEFLLELFEPEFEFEDPGPVTWRVYFQEVHHIFASSRSNLVAALRDADWPEARIARFADVNLDDELPKGSEEDGEYCRMLADAIQDEPEVEGERRLIGEREWAWDLVKSLAGSLPEESSEGTMLGKLRIDPEDSGLRTAYAVGELTLTALQELLNHGESGVQVEFADPPVWRSVNHPVLMGSRDAEIARAVVARTGLEGRARERAILTLMCPWVAGRSRNDEHLADIYWAHEQAGVEGGGRFWLDIRGPLPEFVEACRRFTFDDWYDHCPESQRVYQTTPGYDAYHLWLYSIDLAAWTIRPLTEEIFAHMQATPHCLERWLAGFTEAKPSPHRLAYMARECCLHSRLPAFEEPLRILGT